MDGVTGIVEELDKVVSSGTLGKPGLLLHTDTLWALQSPTSAADWLARLQKKDKEKKELEKLVFTYVCTCIYMHTYIYTHTQM